jgi:Flp pilus assembly protein TadD
VVSGPGLPEPEVVGLEDVELIDEALEAVALGRDLYLAGDLTRAAAAFEDALRADDSSGEALHGLAKALGRADPARARAVLERAVELRPDSFEAWRALAILCRDGGDRVASARALAAGRAAAASDAARDALERDLSAHG